MEDYKIDLIDIFLLCFIVVIGFAIGLYVNSLIHFIVCIGAILLLYIGILNIIILIQGIKEYFNND